MKQNKGKKKSPKEKGTIEKGSRGRMRNLCKAKRENKRVWESGEVSEETGFEEDLPPLAH